MHSNLDIKLTIVQNQKYNTQTPLHVQEHTMQHIPHLYEVDHVSKLRQNSFDSSAVEPFMHGNPGLSSIVANSWTPETQKCVPASSWNSTAHQSPLKQDATLTHKSHYHFSLKPDRTYPQHWQINYTFILLTSQIRFLTCHSKMFYFKVSQFAFPHWPSFRRERMSIRLITKFFSWYELSFPDLCWQRQQVMWQHIQQEAPRASKKTVLKSNAHKRSSRAQVTENYMMGCEYRIRHLQGNRIISIHC